MPRLNSMFFGSGQELCARDLIGSRLHSLIGSWIYMIGWSSSLQLDGATRNEQLYREIFFQKLAAQSYRRKTTSSRVSTTDPVFSRSHISAQVSVGIHAHIVRDSLPVESHQTWLELNHKWVLTMERGLQQIELVDIPFRFQHLQDYNCNCSFRNSGVQLLYKTQYTSHSKNMSSLFSPKQLTQAALGLWPTLRLLRKVMVVNKQNKNVIILFLWNCTF